jgi:hypothetical protein
MVVFWLVPVALEPVVEAPVVSSVMMDGGMVSLSLNLSALVKKKRSLDVFGGLVL